MPTILRLIRPVLQRPRLCVLSSSRRFSEVNASPYLAREGFDKDDVVGGDAENDRSTMQRQIKLEMQQLDSTVAQYRDVLRSVISVGRGSTIPVAQRCVIDWFGPLARSIDAEQAACMAGKPGDDRKIYGQFLVLLPPDKLAVIAIHVS